MTKNEKIHFDKSYQQLLKCLKLQGKADKTIDGTDKLTFKSIRILFHIPIKSLLPLSRTQRRAVLVNDNARLRLSVCPG